MKIAWASGRSWAIGRSTGWGFVALLIALAGLLLLSGQASGISVVTSVSCASPSASHLTITVTGPSSASTPLKISASGGNYVISLGGTLKCTTTTYPDSGTGGYPDVTVSSSSNQYVILDDSNGQLASSATTGCPAQFTTSFPGSLEADGDGSPQVTSDAAIAIGSSTLTLSESCSTSDVSLGTGVQTVVVTGEATSNSLDLPSTSGSLIIDDATSPGTVTGFTNSHLTAVDFTGEEAFTGGTFGGTTFVAGTGGGLKFTGQGNGNTLDVSSLSSPTLNVSGGPAGGEANDTVHAGSVLDSFSGITAFKGSSNGSTTFLAGNTVGFSFAGQGSGNSLDLSSLTSGVSIDATTGTATTNSGTDVFSGISSFVGSSSGFNTFTAGNAGGFSFAASGAGNTLDLSRSTSGSSIDATTGTATTGDTPDVFSGISSFVGSSSGSNTFTPGSAGGLSFTGPGTGNTLNLSHLSSPTVNVTGAQVNSQPNDTVQSGALTDVFSGITSFKGGSGGATTFLAGNTGGLTFTGQGNGNTLDLSALTVSGSTPATVNASTGSASAGSLSDAFSGISTFNGPSAGHTTFVAGSTGPMSFTGHGSGNTLDVSSLSSPAVNVTGGAAGGEANDTVHAGSVLDSFSGITAFKGASGGATTFLAGNTVGFSFAGQGSGNSLDLSSLSSGVSINAITGTATTSSGSDVFSGISSFTGSSSGFNTFVAGNAVGFSFVAFGPGNTLDLSGLTSGASIDASTGTASIGSGSDAFSGISSFIGSSSGSNTFTPGSAGGLAFTGPGTGNTLNLSHLSSPTINVTGATVNSQPNDTVQSGALTDVFSGITTFKGGSGGATTFLAGNTSGLTFTGQGNSNTLDLSALTVSGSTPATVNASTGSASAGSFSDAFSGISTFNGPSAGHTTFVAKNTGPMIFTGHGIANTLDLSPLSSPTLNVSGAAAGGQANDTVQAGSVLDSFSGITAFKGASNGSTTFLAGNAGGFSFAGQGSGNSLDLSSSSSGSSINAISGTASIGSASDAFSGITRFIGSSSGNNVFTAGNASGLAFVASGPGNTLDLSGSSSGSSIDASAGTASIGSGSDAFSGISSFIGSSSGGNTFTAGSAGGMNFTGPGTGNTLNLSHLSSPTINVRGAPVSSQANDTVQSGALTDTFSGITTFKGASGGGTTFLAGNAVGLTFTGQGSGNTLDLSALTTSNSNPVSGLKVSLGGDSAASPGQVTATVGSPGTAVTFATFTSINKVIGSSTLPTGFDPGTATGVALVNITPAPQAIKFTSAPPSPATVSSSYAPQATGGNSGNPVVFSVDPSSGGVCTLTGGTITFTGAGTCEIDANQAGNSEYQPGQAQQSFSITQLAGSGGGTGGSGGGTGGGSGGGGSTAVTPQQILALLVPDTASSTKAQIGALLKSGGVTFSFKAPEAGTALVAWYQVPPGAHLASKRKPVLVATGRLAFPSAGTRKLRLTLTAAGKKLLRHAKRIKLSAKSTFTPSGGAGVSTVRAFTLKR